MVASLISRGIFRSSRMSYLLYIYPLASLHVLCVAEIDLEGKLRESMSQRGVTL